MEITKSIFLLYMSENIFFSTRWFHNFVMSVLAESDPINVGSYSRGRNITPDSGGHKKETSLLMMPITGMETSFAKIDTWYALHSSATIYMTGQRSTKELSCNKCVIIASPTTRIFVANTCKNFNLWNLPCYKDRENWKCVARR